MGSTFYSGEFLFCAPPHPAFFFFGECTSMIFTTACCLLCFTEYAWNATVNMRVLLFFIPPKAGGLNSPSPKM